MNTSFGDIVYTDHTVKAGKADVVPAIVLSVNSLRGLWSSYCISVW